MSVRSARFAAEPPSPNGRMPLHVVVTLPRWKPNPHNAPARSSTCASRNSKLPPKSADCHCHVFGPRDKYPWAANRLYTPPPVMLDDYLAMLAATGFERGVMVQTGLYGSDNRFIVDAIKAHPGRLRAIALIGEDITDRALARSGRRRRARLSRQPHRQDRAVVRGGAQACRAHQGPRLARAVPARHRGSSRHRQLARRFPDRGGDRSHGPPRSAPRRRTRRASRR